MIKKMKSKLNSIFGIAGLHALTFFIQGILLTLLIIGQLTLGKDDGINAIKFLIATVVVSVSFGLTWFLGFKLGKHSRDRVPGKAEAKGTDKESKLNLVMVIKRVWEAGYIAEGRYVYFETICSILSQAGLIVSPISVRSALEIVGCPVSADKVHESDLVEIFHAIDREIATVQTTEKETIEVTMVTS